MKPITNILLIAAIVCYVFLPFRSLELVGSITGFSYTAGLITENFSMTKTLFALLPFISVFGAIAFNSLNSRYWGLAAGIFILSGIGFYMLPDLFETLPINHSPEVVPTNVAVEGFSVKSVEIGYYTSYACMLLAFISCFVSLLPFKFNQVLERKVDDKIEQGINLGKEELHKMEDKIHHKKPVATPAEPEEKETPVAEDKEDPTRFMPKN